MARQLLDAEFAVVQAVAGRTEALARVETLQAIELSITSQYQAGVGKQVEVLRAQADCKVAQARLEVAEALVARRKREVELLAGELQVASSDEAQRQREILALEKELQADQVRIQEQQAVTSKLEKDMVEARKKQDLPKLREYERALQSTQSALDERRKLLAQRSAQLQMAKYGTGKKVTLDFPRLTPAESVINELFSSAGASYIIDQSAGNLPPLTMKLTDIPFDKALNAVAQALGIQYELKDGIYFIRRAGSAMAGGRMGAGSGGAGMGMSGASGSFGEMSAAPSSLNNTPRRLGIRFGSTGTGTDTLGGVVSQPLSAAPARLPEAARRVSRATTAAVPPPHAPVLLGAPTSEVPPPPALPALTEPTAVPPLPAAADPSAWNAKHAIFICPHCKKKETIVQSEKTMQGHWKYCPFCGKRIK